MLRSTTYYDGWDSGIGGHQGVDIASATGTPVLAVADGEVIDIWEKWWRGKTITIKHMQNGKTVYSSYAHLSEIFVKIGNIIKEGWLIGKVGATGNATWPHLHFQIEINDNDNHPFFYKNCIGEINEIVNEARCEKQMRDNTVDPILFIEKKGNIPLKKETTETTDTNKYSTYQNLAFSGFSWGIVDKNQLTKIIITPKINPETMLLFKDPITITYDKQIIKVLPDSFDIITKKQLLIIPQKTGFTSLSFIYNNKVFKKIPVIVSDPTFLLKIREVMNKNPNILKSLIQ